MNAAPEAEKDEICAPLSQDMPQQGMTMLQQLNGWKAQNNELRDEKDVAQKLESQTAMLQLS